MGGLSGQVQAQATAGARVATVNVGLVFTKYEKAHKTELEHVLKPYKTKGQRIIEEMKPYAKALREKKVIDAELKDQYEQFLLQQKRTLEDLELEARKLVAKEQKDRITLCKEVIGAIQDYATKNGYNLVLGYGQEIDDAFTFANVHPSTDISQAVADNLIAAFQRTGGAVMMSGTQK
jgi:Skp family chaperone for outer membrane proteins